MIRKVVHAKKVMEGGGVAVNRVFGHDETDIFDPFLMLDYFNEYSMTDSPGFPWHPHKGIETISYFLNGSGEHQDSIGNKGIIKAGELQWMSAGRGIMHQEMPIPLDGRIEGFQFWVNLPKKDKLKKPEYAFIPSDEMVEVNEQGVLIKVIAGRYKNTQGPIDKSELGIKMFHIKMEANQEVVLERSEGKNGFIFVFDGSGHIDSHDISVMNAYTLSKGKISIKSDNTLAFIFAEGKPINEPISWYGPIVMNTREEIIETYKDIENGTFVKE